MKTLNQSHRKRGMALGLVLVGLLIVSIAAAAFLFQSREHQEITKAELKQKTLTSKAKTNIEFLRSALQIRLSRLMRSDQFPQTIRFHPDQDGNATGSLLLNSQDPARQRDLWRRLIWAPNELLNCNANTCAPLDPALASAVNNRLSSQYSYSATSKESIQLRCIDNCTNGPATFPKVFELRYEVRNEEDDAVVRVSATLGLAPRRVSDIAMLVSRQPYNQPFNFVSGGNRDGKVEVFFDFPQNSAATIQFLNRQPLTFGREVVTNLPSSDRFTFGCRPPTCPTTIVNAPVEFQKGVVTGAANPTSGIQANFQRLVSAPTTTRLYQPGGGYGPVIVEMGRDPQDLDGQGRPKFKMRVYRNVPQMVVDVQQPAGGSQEAGQTNSGGSSNEEGGTLNPPIEINPYIQPRQVHPRSVPQPERNFIIFPYLPSLTISNLVGTEIVTGEGGQLQQLHFEQVTGIQYLNQQGTFNPLTGQYEIQLLPETTINSDRAFYIQGTEVEVRRWPSANVHAVELGDPNVTVIGSNRVSLANSIIKPSDLTPNRGNAAIVSLQGDIFVGPQASTLINGQSLDSIARSGPGSYTGNTFQIDASIVALNAQGKLTFAPSVLCAPGTNVTPCQSVGKLETNGSILVSSFAPFNFSDNDGNIRGGFNQVSANFNDGILSEGGQPPGFNAEDVTSLASQFMGNVSIEYSDLQEATQYFQE